MAINIKNWENIQKWAKEEMRNKLEKIGGR